MIKTLLRHIILNTCISIIFDGISNNFPQSLDTSKLSIGEFVNVRIVVGASNYILPGCKVERYDKEYTYLRYDGFEYPIILVTKDGDLINIQGSIPDIL